MWYFQKNGVQEGPREESEIRELIRAGEIARTTLVWTEGMSDWATAENTALSALFLDTPPPIRSEPSLSALPPPEAVGLKPTQRNDSASPGFRDPRPLAKFVTLLLAVSLVWSLVTIWSGFLQLGLLNQVSSGQNISPEAAESNDTRERVFGLIQVGLFIFTTVVFGRWIYVVARNVRSLGAERLQFTPGWAVGYYFVPIANLFRPYQAMKEIWKASRAPTQWQLEKGSFVLVLWWTLWLISCLVGQIVFRFTMRAQSVDDYVDATKLSFVSDIIEIPLCLIAILLVQRISRTQFVTAASGNPAGTSHPK